MSASAIDAVLSLPCICDQSRTVVGPDPNVRSLISRPSTLSPARLEMTFPPKYGATALQYVWWLKRRSSSPATRTSS